MAAASLDDRGIVVICARCSQKNRLMYGRLGDTVRCGRCKEPLRPIDAPEGDQAARPTATVFGADVSPALSSTETPASPRMRVIQGNNVNDVVFR